VSKTTFYVHKRMRDPLSRFSAPMQTFLKDKPVTVSIPASSAASQKSRKRGNTGQDSTSGSQEADVQVGIISYFNTLSC
jgi:hypothetical protein